ncbi:MAG: hypothetical protein Q8P44_00995, partial [Dehalococcoidia bacterium]|nr:hypothetical protein [Dehalococcoidia bacterium]
MDRHIELPAKRPKIPLFPPLIKGEIGGFESTFISFAGASHIYLGDKSSRQGYWTSFENSPSLEVTRKNIYDRCVPCIENLLDQLLEGRQRIKLNQAYDCWKVVAVLKDETDCLRVLEALEEKPFSLPRIRGRFGSREKEGTKAVIFNADTGAERD